MLSDLRPWSTQDLVPLVAAAVKRVNASCTRGRDKNDAWKIQPEVFSTSMTVGTALCLPITCLWYFLLDNYL